MVPAGEHRAMGVEVEHYPAIPMLGFGADGDVFVGNEMPEQLMKFLVHRALVQEFRPPCVDIAVGGRGQKEFTLEFHASHFEVGSHDVKDDRLLVDRPQTNRVSLHRESAIGAGPKALHSISELRGTHAQEHPLAGAGETSHGWIAEERENLALDQFSREGKRTSGCWHGDRLQDCIFGEVARWDHAAKPNPHIREPWCEWMEAADQGLELGLCILILLNLADDFPVIRIVSATILELEAQSDVLPDGVEIHWVRGF